MSEDLNLPASLERLEINPERVECSKIDQNRNVMLSVNSEPECTLQSLSLKAECPKGNCHCNRKRDKEVTVKRLAFKRPIVRRSKLNALVLRSPVLRLRDSSTSGAVLPSLAQPPTSPALSLPSTSDDIPTLPLPISSTTVGEEERLSEEAEKLSVSSLCNSSTAQQQTLSSTSSCAIQARSSPDDTTIDELASYFDLFVHIPKKMSFMAEMMYT